MRLVRILAAEALALLVDDGWLAAATVAWLVLALVALPLLHLAAAVEGLVLFAGFAALLVESVVRHARR